jgi:hypothetical protein
MVKALKGGVREACLSCRHRQAHQFMLGIVEETAYAGRSHNLGSRLPEASGVARVGFQLEDLPDQAGFPK